MIVLIFLLVGLGLGVSAERLTGDRTAAPNATPAPKRKRRWGRIIAITTLVLVIALLAVGLFAYRWASDVFNSIEKVPVASVLSDDTSAGTNYLLVGSDNGAEGGEQREGVEGRRSDTIMVLNIRDGKAKMLSLNRDLWVANPATGENGRLNATYNAGPANLIQAVTQNFGIPVNHYIEIDFVSFGSMVDSFGGIDIAFEHPAFDLASGLDVKQSGVVHLDGKQALAYVRSRHYAEMIDGQVVLDQTSDLGRVQRQQVFLREIMKEAGQNRSPFTLMKTAENMSGGLRIDDEMTMLEAARFAWDMGRLDPVSVPLPVTPRTTSGGAAVLDLDQPAANLVLDQFR
ncbi:MAG: putative LytR family regulatory protein [Ilumatobacteraceae bacterium]|nr:putative LytR family regulatory protein [Ilumatobacteraceae bacterium]